MNEIPDRLCVDEASPFFNQIYSRLGVKFNGAVRPNDVREYCISEGWIRKELRLKNGMLRRERGRVVTIKMRGVVEVFFR